MIARVFPTKTSMTPIDQHAYYDIPDMFTPKYDEVHISVTFSWDVEKVERLKELMIDSMVKFARGCVKKSTLVSYEKKYMLAIFKSEAKKLNKNRG